MKKLPKCRQFCLAVKRDYLFMVDKRGRCNNLINEHLLPQVSVPTPPITNPQCSDFVGKLAKLKRLASFEQVTHLEISEKGLDSDSESHFPP
jgi:hypothetical protein